MGGRKGKKLEELANIPDMELAEVLGLSNEEFETVKKDVVTNLIKYLLSGKSAKLGVVHDLMKHVLGIDMIDGERLLRFSLLLDILTAGRENVGLAILGDLKPDVEKVLTEKNVIQTKTGSQDPMFS